MPHKKLLNRCICGEDGYVVILPKVGRGNEYYVKCRKCSARTARHPSKDGARAEWNGEDPAEFDNQAGVLVAPPVPARAEIAAIVKRLPEGISDTGEKIAEVLDNLEVFLREKNRRYGNSALAPAGVFYKGQVENALLVRIDDKVSRIQNSVDLRKNDIVDLMGYLTLLCVAQGWTDFSDLID